jgi:serine/threonine-protein kinase HipA
MRIDTRTLPNRLALLDMLIFNVLCCNVDAHAKNYSLLHRATTPVVAPLYDVTCGAVYDGVTTHLSQKIAGKQSGEHIHGRHWTRLAEEIGMSGPQVRRRASELLRAKLNTKPCMRPSGFHWKHLRRLSQSR